MAYLAPFRALRYDPLRVEVSQAVTQPYDKITPQMQERYYATSPYNLVRIVLGKREPCREGDNVYTRAAGFFRDWRREGIFLEDPQPSLYSYSQRFTAPGALTEDERRGFIALGKIEDYSAGVVFRHEQTLAKPKADRLELLRATRAHFGQLFMLYSDAGEIDNLLGSSASPDVDVEDEYGVQHRVWKVSDPALIELICGKMRDKKLLIADGHHRYETALNYRNERRAAGGGAPGIPRERSSAKVMFDREPAELAPYELVMMTFVNMNSAGLLILPTHRVVHGLSSFSAEEFLARSRQYFTVDAIDSGLDAARATSLLGETGRRGTALLAAMTNRNFLLHTPRASESLFAGFSRRQQALDVLQLHKVLLETVLGLSQESIRNQENISYLRDAREALDRVRCGGANITFLMNPVRMEQVRDIAFAGEVLPQKSTDFYPKLLTGLTIYALD
ncbi:MAG: DUF1015 domain-containing protein [Acidobacteria bacterium]|nr:MAG: DUF1015 domain-containing protein [Acidobacteriota bacterium]